MAPFTRFFFLLMVLALVFLHSSLLAIENVEEEQKSLFNETISEDLSLRPVKIDLIPVNGGVSGKKKARYFIAKEAVTVEQYCQFLNAIAADADPYHLYNSGMAYQKEYALTCSIRDDKRVYQAKVNTSTTPITCLSIYSALRFCNWLHNGQPSGKEDNETTEQGAYDLEGAMNGAITRNNEATWFIPTAKEWGYIDTSKINNTLLWQWSSTMKASLFYDNTWNVVMMERGIIKGYNTNSGRTAADPECGFRVAASSEFVPLN